MQKNQTRQQALLEIIGSQKIFSQEELIQKLAERGINATQATLSRDLKALKIIKVTREGYKLPQTSKPSPNGMAMGVIRVEMNLPVCVIYTQVGFAPAVATYLDRHPLAPVMGTVAGDDTVARAFLDIHAEVHCPGGDHVIDLDEGLIVEESFHSLPRS